MIVQLLDLHHSLTGISVCILRETCNPYIQTQVNLTDLGEGHGFSCAYGAKGSRYRRGGY